MNQGGSVGRKLAVKKKTPRDHRFWFIFPFSNRVFRVAGIFDPQPTGWCLKVYFFEALLGKTKLYPS